MQEHLLRLAADGDVLALETVFTEAKRRGDEINFELCRAYARNLIEKIEGEIKKKEEDLATLRYVLGTGFKEDCVVVIESYPNPRKIEVIKLLRHASTLQMVHGVLIQNSENSMGLKDAKDLVDGPFPIIVKFKTPEAKKYFLSESYAHGVRTRNS